MLQPLTNFKVFHYCALKIWRKKNTSKQSCVILEMIIGET